MYITDEDEECTPDPALISGLWAEWVCVVCDREQMPHPTSEEWTALKRNFHLEKAPIDSVAELKQLRSKK